jgi:hypothetical protein
MGNESIKHGKREDIGVWWENYKEDLNVGGWMTLRCNLEK